MGKILRKRQKALGARRANHAQFPVKVRGHAVEHGTNRKGNPAKVPGSMNGKK